MSTNPPPDPADQTTQVSSGDPLGGASPPPPPPPDAGPQPRRLTRSRSDRVLAGVCGGVARYFGVDPVIARIVAVVLVFFGGAGALLYLAAVLLVPTEGAAAGPAPDERNRWLVVLGAVALVVVVGPFVAIPALIAGGLLFPLAFLLLMALGLAWLTTGRWPDRDAGSIAKASALGLGMLVVLGIVAIGAFWAAAAGGDEVVAGLVIASGLAVLAGAFVKPVRWLIPIALTVAVHAGFASAAGIELGGGIGEKRYSPGSAAEVRDRYEVGIGELVVDLRGADLEGEREVDVQVGIGEARIIVPDDVCVVTRAELGAGEVRIFDEDSGGVDVEFIDEPAAKAGNARLIVDAELGLGELSVRHDGRDDFESGPRAFDDGPGSPFAVSGGKNTGCAGS